MNRSYFIPTLLLIGGIVLLLAINSDSNAQGHALTTFSGRAVDEAGNPVEGLTITLVSVFDGNGAWFPVHEDQHGSPIDPPTFRAETDAEGHFTITDTISGPVLLRLLPFGNVDAQLLKTRIRGLFFYATGMWERGIVLTSEQGDYIENIEVTVQYPHIRGKVQRVDSTPIANERVKFRVQTFSLNGRSSSSSSTHTDTEGYFGYYVNENIKEPTFYTLSITYQGQTVNANPIVLQSGDPTQDIVFTIDSPSVPPLPTQLKNFASATASVGGSSALDVWVIRPESWHAYKMIERQRWESAQAQAATEGAYLVAINDESEQNWLQAVFGNEPTWIGLNDIAKEGQWQWDSGEPLTYTNWRAQELHDPGDVKEDYVIMNPSGKWEAVNPRDMRWRFIQTAIIEKEKPPLKK